MTFGERVRQRRGELGLSRAELAEELGVTVSAVGNYEKGVSFPKEEVLLRLFDCLQAEPNTLFQDSYQKKNLLLTGGEQRLVQDFRRLSPAGQAAVRAMIDALFACREEAEALDLPPEVRQIPLYRSPDAAGMASPAFGADFDYIPVSGPVPPGAEFAVRMQDGFMAPCLQEGDIAYVNRDPLRNGDAGLFCVDGGVYCRQYYQDPSGAVYLFALDRSSGGDLFLAPGHAFCQPE